MSRSHLSRKCSHAARHPNQPPKPNAKMEPRVSIVPNGRDASRVQSRTSAIKARSAIPRDTVTVPRFLSSSRRRRTVCIPAPIPSLCKTNTRSPGPKSAGSLLPPVDEGDFPLPLSGSISPNPRPSAFLDTGQHPGSAPPIQPICRTTARYPRFRSPNPPCRGRSS